MQDEFLTMDHWLEFLLVNVDNEGMTDAGFREFIRHNLPTVIGHARVRKGLVKRGRISGETDDK